MALDRVAALEKELSKLKADFDKKFGGAREDVEVEAIKKKMAITITELEMALDASNKSNGQLQLTAKGQAEKIMQLTAAYDDLQKKLGASAQQYDITVKRLTQIEAELKTVTVNYNNSVKVVKDYETKFAAMNKNVAEQTKLMKIDNAKKALEKQVHSLSVKIEEIETNSVATSKRTIQKMEIRITELEEIRITE